MRRLCLVYIVYTLVFGMWSGAETSACAQNFALSTNLVEYANFGTLNLEASYAVDRHWSLNASAKYNPFIYNSGEDALVQKQRSLSTGARFWPWHIFSGWWLSGMVKYQEYSSGGIRSPQTTEGDRFGAGLGGGYTYMISPKINLEFGAVFWSGYDKYTSYRCPTCGRVTDKGSKIFFLPSDIMLGLSYIF